MSLILTEEDVRNFSLVIPHSLEPKLSHQDDTIFIYEGAPKIFFTVSMNRAKNRLENMEEWYSCHPYARPGANIDINAFSENLIEIGGTWIDSETKKLYTLEDSIILQKYQEDLASRRFNIKTLQWETSNWPLLEDIVNLMSDYRKIGKEESIYQDGDGLDESAKSFFSTSGLRDKLREALDTCFRSINDRFPDLLAFLDILPYGGLTQTKHEKLIADFLKPLFKENLSMIDKSFWLKVDFLVKIAFVFNIRGVKIGITPDLIIKHYVSFSDMIRVIKGAKYPWEAFLDLLSIIPSGECYNLIDAFGGPLKVHPEIFKIIDFDEYLDYLLSEKRISDVESLLAIIENIDYFEEENSSIATERFRGRIEEIDRMSIEIASTMKRNKELETIIRENQGDLSYWIDRFFFPLASILWKYKSTADSKEKCDHLLHFFEALAQFLFTIMLSGYYWVSTDLDSIVSNCFVESQDTTDLKAASFAFWLNKVQCFAKKIRPGFSNRNEFDELVRRFGTDDKNFFEWITDKKLYTALAKAVDFRNRNKGHGGLSDKKAIEALLHELESLLKEIRWIIEPRNQRMMLIHPCGNVKERGVYHFTVQSLTGAHITFPEIQIDTSIPLDSAYTYLINYTPGKVIENALMIVPFFIIRPAPQTESITCYFYNRFEKTSIRWVSYHYEKEGEIYEPNEDILRFIDQIDKGKQKK